MKSKIVKNIFSGFLVVLGAFIVGLAFNAFIAENGIVIGGISGLCILIADLINFLFNTQISFIVPYIIVNGALLLLCLKYIGKKFAIFTILGVLTYTLSAELCTFMQNVGIPSEDLMLCAIFCGVIMGFGCGVTIRFGGSTGGADLIACLLNKYNSKISVGTVNILLNTFVIALTIVTDGISLSLYGLINIWLCGVVTDFVIQGSQGVSAYYIISRKSDDISRDIMLKLNRSVTAFYARALTTEEDIKVLCCVVHAWESNQLKGLIYDIDTEAFVFATRVNEALNKGFSRLDINAGILNKLKKRKKRNVKVSKVNTSGNKIDASANKNQKNIGDDNSQIESVETKKILKENHFKKLQKANKTDELPSVSQIQDSGEVFLESAQDKKK